MDIRNHDTVVVTGGSAGIGAEICGHLLEAGLKVVALARREPEFSHENLSSYTVDLVDPEATRKVAAQVCADHAVTGIVNNAGVIRAALLEDVGDEDLVDLTNLHVGAAISLMKAALPGMKDRGFGRVVNMSSRAVIGLPTRTVYSATKAAMLGLTRTWAMELGPHGITVNAIAPGPVVTDMFTDVVPEESDKARKIAEGLPVGRLGRPDDIARATLFFLDASNGFVTGQTLYVCGGASLGSLAL